MVTPAFAALTLIFRSAWLISRACAPTWTIPISPSISERGTSAATESTTMRSTALLRTRRHDFQSHLARLRLAHDDFVDVKPEPLRVLGVERVLGVDQRDGPAHLLHLRHGVQRERGLPGGLGAVNLHDAPAGHATPERDVQGHGARGKRAHLGLARAPELHDAPLAEVGVDLT